MGKTLKNIFASNYRCLYPISGLEIFILKENPNNLQLTLFRMGLFVAACGWGGGEGVANRPPPS